jgi:predicted RNase H-like HicB family nuclease
VTIAGKPSEAIQLHIEGLKEDGLPNSDADFDG